MGVIKRKDNKFYRVLALVLSILILFSGLGIGNFVFGAE